MKSEQYDPFEPRKEPARSIYLAFQKEAGKREGRLVHDWTRAERDAVHAEAVRQAHRLGLRVPTLQEVVDAERYARGHIDYGAKWAFYVTEAMNRAPEGHTNAK